MCDVTPVTHGGQRSKVENKYSGRPETAKCNFEIKLFVVFGIRGKLMNNRVSVKIKMFFEPWRLHYQYQKNIARIANAVQVTINLLVFTSVY